MWKILYYATLILPVMDAVRGLVEGIKKGRADAIEDNLKKLDAAERQAFEDSNK